MINVFFTILAMNFTICFHLSKVCTYTCMYTVLNTHTQSNYNMWSVQFTLTIITYVLHFLYNQQKSYNYFLLTNKI